MDDAMHELKGRHFQVWDYSPSHSRLLIRSPYRGAIETNVDIVFWGVKRMNLVTVLGEISIEEQVSDERTTKIFTLRTATKLHTIDAVSYGIYISRFDHSIGLEKY